MCAMGISHNVYSTGVVEILLKNAFTKIIINPGDRNCTIIDRYGVITKKKMTNLFDYGKRFLSLQMSYGSEDMHIIQSTVYNSKRKIPFRNIVEIVPLACVDENYPYNVYHCEENNNFTNDFNIILHKDEDFRIITRDEKLVVQLRTRLDNALIHTYLGYSPTIVDDYLVSEIVM